MDEHQPDRFTVVISKKPPRGDLYELEQKTTFEVVDRLTGEVVLSFEGLMEASLSRSSGLWEDYTFSGVCQVTITEDGASVIVSYCDGRQEIMTLPQST